MPAEAANGQAPRYELRLFAPDLRALEAEIRRHAPLARYREGLELYLLVAGRPDCNLKIRDGALEMKRLHHRERGLEQWRPAFRHELPAAADLLSAELGGLFALAEPLFAGGEADAAEVARRLGAPDVGVAPVSLFKRRWGFVIDDCLVEVVEALINGARLMSAALESADPRAVLALRERLQIAPQENVSYVLAVERVLGRAPLPHDAYYNARPD
jgi:hypothetical protein